MVANKQQKSSGGSALKRLKKSLQTAGVVGQNSKASRSKKDRKRGKPTEVGKNDADKKLSLIRGEFNPFEQKTQKQKFEILGRKMKGVTGKPTLSKQIGEENRKKTLLVEMKNKNRQGGIIDKRFGENNPFITPEEKMLERFTRERQKTSKATMFNLDDDDQDLSLTHYGQSLSTMDDFDDAGLALSDEEDGAKQMDANIVSQMHFGGFEDDAPEQERHKSKNEIMKEIIAKSKMHKAERQLAKQEDDALRENLDEELNDIRGLLETSKRKPLPSQTALFKRSEAEKEDVDDYSDYDKAIFELASDQRAQATDRTKTEEEIAVEEKEKLEKAERARKRRMEGLDSESEDESGYKKMRAVKKRKGAPQGDDLEDDYLEELDEEVDRLGRGLTLEQIQNALNDDDDDDESGEEEEGSDDDEEEDDDDEEGETDNEDLEDEDDEPLEFGDDDDDDMNEIGANGTVKTKSKKKTASKEDKKELPFTFECPTTHEEFLGILEGFDVEDAVTVSKRIRVLYNIKLGQENKNKLSQFIQVLVDHIGYLASTVSPMPTDVIEKLTLDVYDICQQLPDVAGNVFAEKLKNMETELGKKMKYNGSAWPAVEDMTVLRLIGQVFSTSDLNHPIATPSLLFINQALSQCRVQTENDIGRGLFLTLFAFEYQQVSKRIIPESLNFLAKCLILLSPPSLFEQVPGYFPLPAQKVEFSINQSDGKAIDRIAPIQFDSFENEKQDKEAFKFSLLQGVLNMIEKYIQLYASTPAFIELYSDTLEVLKQMSSLEWHPDISAQVKKLIDRLERQIKFSIEKRIKTPLLLQQHRPIPIAQHLPKFEKAYSMDRHYDPDHERSQQHKLEAQIKKEKKGALRELRKDNAFIARERAKERKQKDDAYNKMVKGVMNLLEGEQSEQNRLDKEKAKK